jgi:hypothetical protein
MLTARVHPGAVAMAIAVVVLIASKHGAPGGVGKPVAPDCQAAGQTAYDSCIDSCRVGGAVPETCCGVSGCCSNCLSNSFNKAFDDCCAACNYDPSCNCTGSHAPQGCCWTQNPPCE